MTQATQRPRGREEIVDAVIRAATTLFADRGPASVSLREVATAANVTLSQIHRHIGNKHDLLAAVLTAEVVHGQLPFTMQDDHAPAGLLMRAFRVDGDASMRSRLQARVVLDGFDLLALQSSFPAIDFAVSILAQSLPEEPARVRAAFLAAVFAGWELLGPTYLRAAGVSDISPERFAAAMAPVFDALAATRELD